ncbi:MAG: S8 family serine peptidase [Omnitrophica WOR_2 bacterium]
MTDEPLLPAWSGAFSPQELRHIAIRGPLADITREWAWGGSAGRGVQVAVVDSGIEAGHPALEGCVRAGVVVEYDERAESRVRIEPDEPLADLSGHGTACAGIIHSIAPEAELYSVRVLGRNMSGKAFQFAGGLRWAIDNGMRVINLSLSTAREEYFGLFHRLADDAYFKNVILVSAVNNIPAASYPSLYSSVVSVAAHQGQDPFTYYYNPSPPVEFGAPGIDVEVCWLNGQYSIVTGNSFAAPHIAGLAALILANHPDLTPFELKTVLVACASNSERAEKD